jgi:hypothetical protein
MRRTPLSSRLALPFAAISLMACAQFALAQTPAGKPDATSIAAAEACEQAARQALVGNAVRPGDVTFAAPPIVQTNLSNDSQVVLRGVARLQGAGGLRSISYSCNVDPRTSEMLGVVTRDTTPVAVAAAPAEPNLSELSPAACESSAAEALKQRWPRVSEITFDTATRTFKQQSNSQAELHGSGRAVPAPRSPSTFFGFDCEIDPRDGRVLHTSLSW